MLKNILNLEGAQQLSKNEQQAVNGGKDSNWCKRNPAGSVCGGNSDYVCYGYECVYCPSYPICQ